MNLGGEHSVASGYLEEEAVAGGLIDGPSNAGHIGNRQVVTHDLS